MDPEERRLRVHELRVEILLQVGSGLASTIRFSPRSTYPTLDNTVAMRVVMERERLDACRILFDDSEETELERCRGSWRPAMSSLAGETGRRPDVDAAAELFERHVLPMQRAVKTRKKYCTAWRAVCTWALSQGALGQILPMTQKALHAFMWDALSFQCTLPVVSEFMKAIQARHKHFRFGSPIGRTGTTRDTCTASAGSRVVSGDLCTPYTETLWCGSCASRVPHTERALGSRVDA